MAAETFDFSGWATKNDIRCSDGRTIRQDAFKDDNGRTVPLVWMHDHDSIDNVLGHVVLENRPEGVYAYGKFNNNPSGVEAKEALRNGDLNSLSIYANHLKQSNGDVIHGKIREVSLVYAGANEGATIDNVMLAHGDGWAESPDEATIEMNELVDNTSIDFDVDTISHADEEPKKAEKDEAPKEAKGKEDNKPMAEENTKTKDSENETAEDVFNTLTDKQKKVVYAMIGVALQEKGGAKKNDSEDEEDDEEEKPVAHSDDEGEEMKYNVFENTNDDEVLSHSDMEELTASAVADAKRGNITLREAFIKHADQDYGIKDIDILFPDAKTITSTPEFVKRETKWVAEVMNKTHHTPFSRVKSVFADITEDDARAKGYTKGKLKKNEVFGLLKRTTEPCTIYKKQKLDRDDVVDITDFDVIAWLKGEMRIMLDEEIARAILVGDGREAVSEDKIPEDKIRPIAKDTTGNFYAVPFDMEAATAEDAAKVLADTCVTAMDEYKGSGSPTGFIRQDVYTRCKLLKDSLGYRLYKTDAELANAMMVSSLVPIPTEIMGDNFMIVVNLNDYNVGADKGGSVSMFDDFDIDYNAQKYLMETRCSGALTKYHSALVFRKKAAGGAGEGH